MSKDKIYCSWCGVETQNEQTKECNSCWELRHRIEADFLLAKKMLKQLKGENND